MNEAVGLFYNLPGLRLVRVLFGRLQINENLLITRDCVVGHISCKLTNISDVAALNLSGVVLFRQLLT